ncbi:uncharacterized protein UV8b_06941 [Ustilaginoidea virens]|uniref:mRNA export factor GLE1 n=2 Tax=Ustilaginoidea virens TaxID=1159556 RepID=A0A8E5HW39_USTVR|nr:uncharacterized protein UV8b_06941 [Ustilaginoidea virens]QUC22700.1 hypothetical protein UV8b_06941 [Ustilaginoidea virens]
MAGQNTMANSSPLRRSQLLSSPDRSYLSNLLLDGRNTEFKHLDALAAAQLEHDRVREAAIRVYELHELREEHNRILEQERWELERLKAEAAVAAEEKRLQELRAKSIPKSPPEPEPETAKPSGAPSPPPSAGGTLETKKSEPAAKAETRALPNGLVFSLGKPAAAVSGPAGAGDHNSSQSQQTTLSPKQDGLSRAPERPFAAQQPTAQPQVQVQKQQQQQQQQEQQQQQQQQQKTSLDPVSERYAEIHQALKQLRRDVVAASKVAGSPLKGKVGAIRREIRVSIGQLTGGKGANAQPTSRIMALLRQSLDGQLPSPPVDVNRFVVVPREASAQDVPHNDATLPSFFIYLVNILAKGVINQFINECGANPKAADPIGVFAAQIFSHWDFSWRGESIIDILVAKLRVACPVLFGSRGNDTTERGRRALGWKKDGPSWVPEQNHNDRMAGLGAGFAAISLRDFSKASNKANPFPPTNYWRAFACIVNCPAGEISNTQLVVLRSMIDGHEQRFLNFYGNAALAALRLALVEFPKRAPANSPAAGSLRALADILRSDGGLVLA